MDTDIAARTESLKQRLARLHDRIQWMADEEKRTAWIGGFSAEASAIEEKERLIDETEKLLDELEKRR